MEKPKLRIDPATALKKAGSFCSYRERCQQEVRNKLYEWGLFPKEVEQIISQLISENFLNEERFAKAFASGKFRIKGWGRNKIRVMLRQLGLNDYCIRKGLDEIDEGEYRKYLERLIEKKARTVKEANEFKRKNKIAAFVTGKGFERELVWEILND